MRNKKNLKILQKVKNSRLAVQNYAITGLPSRGVSVKQGFMYIHETL